MSSHGPFWRSSGTSVFLVAVATLVAPGCSSGGDRQPDQKSKPQPSVKTVAVLPRAITEGLELTGSIEPTRLARMASPVEGPVVTCPVREADRVRPGQLLARLGRAKGDDAVAASARAELEREELELSRMEKLVETGALPGEELDKTRVRASEARAKLARATERLGDYSVGAPWSGVVSRVHVAVGDFVPARAPLVELFDPQSLVLRFAVPEDAAARVKDGAPIEVAIDAHPGRTFTAKVTRIFPDIDRRTHTRTVEAIIDGDVALVPGMFARLRLTLASAPEALVVPTEAIVRRDGRPMVFVVTSDGIVDERAVEIGIEDGAHVQIIEGVREGEPVAVAGHTRLRSGMKVALSGAPGGKGGDGHGKGKRAPGAKQ